MRSTKVKETQATGKFTALFDFSVRTGPDIFKVPASGTQAVLRKSLFLSHSSSQPCYGLRTVTDRYCSFVFLLVGPPYVYGLALGGADGFKHVMKMILTYLEVTMSLSGYKNIDVFRGKANAVLAKAE